MCVSVCLFACVRANALRANYAGEQRGEHSFFFHGFFFIDYAGKQGGERAGPIAEGF